MVSQLTSRARWLRLQRLRREACPLSCSPLALPLLLGTAVIGSSVILWQAQHDTAVLNQRLKRAFLADLVDSGRDLQETTVDWANWDPSVAFLQGRDPGYFKDNVSGATLRTMSVMALLNRSGEVVGAVTHAPEGLDSRTGLRKIQPLSQSERRTLRWITPAAAATKPLLTSVQWRGELSMLASHPVRGTNGTLPSAGSVVLIRPINNSMSGLSRALGVSVCNQFQDCGGPAQPGPWIETRLPKEIGGAPLKLRFAQTEQRWQNAWQAVAGLIGLEIALLATVANNNLRTSRRLRRQAVTNGRQALRLNRSLRQRATHDSLTGLPCLEGLLEALPAQQQRYPDFERVLLVVDLDRFSLLNSAIGREAADRVLQQVARQLQALVHRSSLVGRVGPDKFALALVGTSREALQAEVRELADRLGDLTVRLQGEQLSISACIGARWLGRDDAPDQAINEAGFACDMAKLGAGREVMFFGEGESTLVAYKTLQQNHQTLRQAVRNDRMVLFSQVARRLDTPGAPGEGAVAYVELLARVQDPEGSHLYWSEAYLEAAEFWGTLAQFDLHMLGLACRAIREVLESPQGAALPPDVVFALNITDRSLLSGDFSLQVARCLGENGIPPQRLCLEITEQVAMEHLLASRTVIERLKGIGVRVALDDFGAGMTSLSQLRELPLDYVKIDRAFTANLSDSPTNQAVVRFIAELGQQLHFRTIAEGVEDPGTALVLQELGVSMIQGFLISRPEPFSATPGQRNPWRADRLFKDQ